MDTKDTAEKTAPSVAPAKPAPAPKPAGDPEPVGGPESKEKEKKKQAVDRGVQEAYTGDGYRLPDEAPFEDTPRMRRELRAPLISLQYPLQQPPHPQPHIQLHPHPQPLHLWLSV